MNLTSKDIGMRYLTREGQIVTLKGTEDSEDYLFKIEVYDRGNTRSVCVNHTGIAESHKYDLVELVPGSKEPSAIPETTTIPTSDEVGVLIKELEQHCDPHHDHCDGTCSYDKVLKVLARLQTVLPPDPPPAERIEEMWSGEELARHFDNDIEAYKGQCVVETLKQALIRIGYIHREHKNQLEFVRGMHRPLVEDLKTVCKDNCRLLQTIEELEERIANGIPAAKHTV